LPAGLVDLIIGGHVHKGMAHEVNGIPIISSWSGGRFFGRVDFQLADGRLVGHHVFAPTRICRFVDVGSDRCRASAGDDHTVVASYEGRVVHPDTQVANVLAPAIAAAAALKQEQLGPVLETPFERRPDPESSIGNLFTDILLASDPSADVAIHNTLGGIRADLPAGPLTYGSIYEMFPFDNRIVRLTLSGADLRTVLANQIEGPVRHAQVSGIRVRAVCDRSALVLTMYDRYGREIGDNANLLVITNDFLTTGGDGILTPVMPASGFPVDHDGQLLRDIIVDWMRATGGRLREQQFIDDDNPRWIFPEPAPVRCEMRKS
jgi:5'-nucleotidase